MTPIKKKKAITLLIPPYVSYRAEIEEEISSLCKEELFFKTETIYAKFKNDYKAIKRLVMTSLDAQERHYDVTVFVNREIRRSAEHSATMSAVGTLSLAGMINIRFYEEVYNKKGERLKELQFSSLSDCGNDSLHAAVKSLNDMFERVDDE